MARSDNWVTRDMSRYMGASTTTRMRQLINKAEVLNSNGSTGMRDNLLAFAKGMVAKLEGKPIVKVKPAQLTAEEAAAQVAEDKAAKAIAEGRVSSEKNFESVEDMISYLEFPETSSMCDKKYKMKALVAELYKGGNEDVREDLGLPEDVADLALKKKDLLDLIYQGGE